MPVKDTAEYLHACLDSILDQTYTHWELIAVDDGSSDNSFSILQEYDKKDKRVITLQNPEPSLLKALRFGYAHSSGELIHRMDSDDKMPANKLQTMYEAYTSVPSHFHPVLITGGTEYFSDEGPVGDGFKRYDKWLMDVANDNSHAIEVYKECVIPSNCWLVHRSDFDKIGGFEPSTFPEDYDLCYRFIEGSMTIIGLPKVLHHWRDRSDRISRNWDVYKDNRFFELKVDYFFKINRDNNRPLVLWGAGKNGKDLAKLISKKESKYHWICDNDKKIGKDIYGTKLQHFELLKELISPQIIIAVASPDGQTEILQELENRGKIKGKDYWFFA